MRWTPVTRPLREQKLVNLFFLSLSLTSFSFFADLRMISWKHEGKGREENFMECGKLAWSALISFNANRRTMNLSFLLLHIFGFGRIGGQINGEFIGENQELLCKDNVPWEDWEESFFFAARLLFVITVNESVNNVIIGEFIIEDRVYCI